MTKIIMGVEIGGTKLQLALGTTEGKILYTFKDNVNVTEGGPSIRQWLKKHIPALMGYSKDEYGPVAAIGCGFGGPLDKSDGRILKSIQVSGWDNFDIKYWFEDQFSLPTIVENDSNAATWGEYCIGSGRGCQHLFYTNLGSGIGGGFVFDGKLYEGQGIGVGEFGHTYVPDWTANRPGVPIEVEKLCSGWAIEARLRSRGYVPAASDLLNQPSEGINRITCRDLANSAYRKDHFASCEIDRVAHSLGIALANVLSLTNVEKIIIGGGVSQMGDLLIDPIKKYTQQYAFLSSTDRYLIHQSALGESVVLVGAILLAKEVVNQT